MLRLLCFGFLIAMPLLGSASVVYKFEDTHSSDYFEVLFRFDGGASCGINCPVPPGDVEAENFDEFSASYDQGNFPYFLFSVELVATNLMPGWYIPSRSVGYTSIVADVQPMKTAFEIEIFGYIEVNSLSIEREYFPTDWQVGADFLHIDSSVASGFILTEVTHIPVPAALPLFSFSMLSIYFVRNITSKGYGSLRSRSFRRYVA